MDTQINIPLVGRPLLIKDGERIDISVVLDEINGIFSDFPKSLEKNFLYEDQNKEPNAREAIKLSIDNHALRIRTSLDEFDLSDREQIDYLNRIIRKTGIIAELHSTQLPSIAPERWKGRFENRSDIDNKIKDESPIDFFARVYEPWLDKITRADLRAVDIDLYAAINRSIQINKDRLLDYPENIQNALQSKKGKNDAAVAEYQTTGSLAGRELDRREKELISHAAAKRRR